jgi:RNA polymerase sigma-54 factor
MIDHRMNPISHKLQIVLRQKQILTPALMQMVRILQLNRLELKDMIAEEIAQNPLLEEVGEGGEELTPAELQVLLETQDRDPNQVDNEVLKLTKDALQSAYDTETDPVEQAGASAEAEVAAIEPAADTAPGVEDAFGQVDLDDFFRDFNEPGFRSQASDDSDKPGFEFFPVLTGDADLASHEPVGHVCAVSGCARGGGFHHRQSGRYRLSVHAD